MDSARSAENDMLLLMDQPQLEEVAEPVSNQDYVTSTYNAQQLVLSNNCDMDIESLDDLLANQGISLENGELSVIEQNGQQYVLLPNVSVAEVLESNTTTTTHHVNTTMNYDQPLIVASIPSTIHSNSGSVVPPSISLSSSVNMIPVMNNIPTVTVSTPSKTSQNFKDTSNDVDIQRLVPSLYPKPRNLSCQVCDFVATTDLALDQHMEEHRESLNNKIYTESRMLSMPKKKRKQRKKNTCRFFRSVAFTNEPKKGPFLCSVCGVQIELITAYKRHMKAHLNEKEFKCSICSESFNIESNMTLHKALHTEFSEKNGSGYVCPSCNRTFTRVASLKAHLPIHYVDETLICTECGDEFSMKSDLDRHMDQHRIELQRSIGERREKQAGMYSIDDAINGISAYGSVTNKSQRRKKSEPQRCMYCDKVFQKESLFKRHVLIHTGEKPFACESCGKSFNQASALKTHQTTHTGEKPFTCSECSQVFSQRGNLRVHQARAHSNRSFVCPHCPCTFQKSTTLNTHVKRYHSEDDDDQLLETPSMIDSTDTVDNDENLPYNKDVDVIQQLLSTFNDSNENNSVPSDIVQQALEECGVDQSSNNNLNTDTILNEVNSALSSTSNQNGVDKSIDAQSVSSSPLTQTTDVTSTDSQVKSLTMLRDKVIYNNSAKQRSNSGGSDMYMRMGSSGRGKEMMWKVRKVNGVRWHRCMYCTKEFKKPSDLVRHIRTHTNERPFTCKTCKKSFAVKTTLSAHEKIHLGHKPFKCQVCSKCFSTSGSLKIHTRLHTGARPFKCTQCDMRFRTTGHRHLHLQSHMRGTARKKAPKPRKNIIRIPLLPELQTTNVTLKDPIRLNEDGVPITSTEAEENVPPVLPHVCDVCQKAFKRASHLQQHIRTHTGERPYQCQQCGASFATPSILKTHLHTHTGYKPHRCDICGQSFLSHFSLTRHVTTHSQSRHFMCPYCKKTFKTSGACKKHILMHKKNQTLQLAALPPHQSTIDTNSVFQLINTNVTSNHQNISMLPLDGVPGIPTHVTTIQHPDIEQASLEDVDLCRSEDILQFQETELEENELELAQNVNALSGFVDTNIDITLNNESRHHDNDLANQFYQVDQVLNFKCSGCSKYFETKSHLQRHEYELTLKKSDFPCTLCSHSLDCDKTLASHVASHCKEVVHRCPTCFVGFDDPNIATKHASSAHPNPESLLSEQTIEVESSLNENNEANNNKNVESERKRSSKRRTGFYRLSKEQNKILEETDPDQVMTISEKILLSAVADKDKISHAQKPGTRGRCKDLNGPILPHVCPHCPKSFRKKHDLSRHIRTHTGDKPFECKTCGKRFTVKSTLKVHEKCHLKTKTFRCHICDTLYSSKASLKIHMSLHTGATPYKCPHCPAMFRTPCIRKHHMVSHFVQPNKARNPPATSSTTEAPSSVVVNSSEASVASNAFSTTTTTTTAAAAAAAASSTIRVELPNTSSTCQSKPTSTSSQSWTDLAFISMDNIINSTLMQDSDSVPFEIQTQGLSMDGTNITLQIDPAILQSLQDNHSASSSATGAQPLNWSSDVILQPFNQACLLPISSEQGTEINSSVEAVNPHEISSELPPLQPLSHVLSQVENSTNHSAGHVTLNSTPRDSSRVNSQQVISSTTSNSTHVANSASVSTQPNTVQALVNSQHLISSPGKSLIYSGASNQSGVERQTNLDDQSLSINSQTLFLLTKQLAKLVQVSGQPVVFNNQPIVVNALSNHNVAANEIELNDNVISNNQSELDPLDIATSQ